MSNYFQASAKLGTVFKDSDYLYLLLEPVFIYGITLGLIAFIIAYFIKNTPFQILALSLIALSSLAMFPYLSMRVKAQDRIDQVYHIEAPNHAKNFKENTQQRKSHLWLYVVVTVTAGFAAMIGPRRNRLGLLFAIICLGFAAKSIQFSIWMHYQDALVSHPHLKHNDSPVQKRLKEKKAE